VITLKKADDNNNQSQLDLLMEYFKKNPNRNISYPKVVDWATREWKKQRGKVFHDPDRGIRGLSQTWLID
jgi:hypothetical protein